MKIALTTDHTGIDHLKQLKTYLESLGHECVNFGPERFVPDDDYPDYMFPAARAVANGECEFAVIVGGSGQGEAIAANRVNGVRCAVYYGPARPLGAVDAEGNAPRDEFEILRLSRQHNNANVLSLAARFVTSEDMKHAVKLWLETPFSHVDRHLRRINKLDLTD